MVESSLIEKIHIFERDLRKMGGRIFHMGIQDPLYPLLRVREYISGVGQAGCSLEVIVRGSLESCQYQV